MTFSNIIEANLKHTCYRTYLSVWMARLRELYRDGSPTHTVSTAFFRAAVCFFGFPVSETNKKKSHITVQYIKDALVNSQTGDCSWQATRSEKFETQNPEFQ